MKKSSLILWGVLVAMLLFSFIFQLSVHSYVKDGKTNRKPAQMLMQNRVLPDFSSIMAHGRLKIYIEQKDTAEFEVNAPNYIIDSVRTSVLNNVLDIQMGSSLKKKDSIVIKISNPELNRMKFGSKVSIESVGVLSGSNLHLDFSEKSSGNLQLSYENLKYSNTSSGVVTLNGNISQIELIEKRDK